MAAALNDYGYKTCGVRIDSGDLAYLSNQIRLILKTTASLLSIDWLADIEIIATNDINEETILSLNELWGV